MLDISAQSAIISTVLKSEDNAGSEKAFNGAELSDGICESAGTGRQARLRGVCQPTWEFKSPLSHQRIPVILIQRNDGYFIPKISFLRSFGGKTLLPLH